jgi:DNA repair protein RadA/Sms
MSNMNLSVGLKSWKRGTNILDLEVPAQLERTVKTGLSWFDEAVSSGEGMTPSTAMMLTGTPGAGKTTMCLQLADSITKTGSVCLFNTGEESLFQVRKVARRLNVQHGFVAGQDILVSNILTHADHLRKSNPGKQVFLVLDSLQTLDDGKYSNGTNSMTQVRATEMITNWCKETYGIALIIGQVTKNGDFAGKQTLKHAVDAHGHLFIDEQKNSDTYGERLFEIQKNRFGANGKTFILGMNRNGLYEKGSYSFGG